MGTGVDASDPRDTAAGNLPIDRGTYSPSTHMTTASRRWLIKLQLIWEKSISRRVAIAPDYIAITAESEHDPISSESLIPQITISGAAPSHPASLFQKTFPSSRSVFVRLQSYQTVSVR